MNAPLYLARSGRVGNDSVLIAMGDYGYYWSSTINSSERACSLYILSGYISPEFNNGRQTGLNLRCVLREFLIVSPEAQPTADLTPTTIMLLLKHKSLALETRLEVV